MKGALAAFAALVGRDLRVVWRHGAEAGLAATFFVLCVALFPLGVGPEPEVLSRIAGGVVWASALLASLLALDRLFALDLDDGSLDILALSPLPLELAVLAKASAHGLVTGVPLLLAAPVMALLLHMPSEVAAVLAAALLLGLPTLSLAGVVGAALTLGARRGAVLATLVILPFDIPVLVFGTGAVNAAASGMPTATHLLALASLLLAALPLAPLAAAAALRAAQD